jgi:16S rRNA G966 N2-methylase RsmD
MGGKRRYARRIWDWIETRPHVTASKPLGFTDVCCGGGSLTFEALHRGVPVEQVTMIDSGPWGGFWERIAANRFDLAYWRHLVSLIPSDPREVKPWLDERKTVPPQPDTWVYWWLIFQQAAFGGKPLTPNLESGSWGDSVSFAPYWEHPHDGRVKKTLPDMTRITRSLEATVSFLGGRIRAIQEDANQTVIPDSGVVYVDPPYESTTTRGYSGSLDWSRITQCGAHVFVSETTRLAGSRDAVCLNSGVLTATMNTKRVGAGHQEWLSWFPPAPG